MEQEEEEEEEAQIGHKIRAVLLGNARAPLLQVQVATAAAAANRTRRRVSHTRRVANTVSHEPSQLRPPPLRKANERASNERPLV